MEDSKSIFQTGSKSDGTFRHKGEKFVERLGESTGTVPLWCFHQLPQLIRDSGYMDLGDGYTRTVTDNPTTYTMVVMKGKRKTVRNYANAGPTKLWAIEQLIDDLMSKAKWDPQKTPDKTEMKRPNKPAAPNAGIASRLTIECPWPGVGEPKRSAA